MRYHPRHRLMVAVGRVRDAKRPPSSLSSPQAASRPDHWWGGLSSLIVSGCSSASAGMYTSDTGLSPTQ
jgi:hypothetical protein